MPWDRRLSTVLARGEDASRFLGDVAAQLAELHRRELPVEGFGLARTMSRLWREVRDQLVPFGGVVLPRDELDAVSALGEEYVAGRVCLLEARERTGHVRAGHGDLLAEDIFCLDDGARILDCLEFDERLRAGDALLDAAYLAMDLEAHGQAAAGRWFLDQYDQVAGVDAPASLVHHYIAYRAVVRAKAECLRSAQGATGAMSAARDLLALSRRHLMAGRIHLVLVGGLPGSGKSAVAEALADADPHGRQWVSLSSDVVRKELTGREPRTASAAAYRPPYRQGIYTRAHTEATYAELLHRARRALNHGVNVVVDASWSDALFRVEARQLATDCAAALTEVRCEAPLDVCAHRLADRRNPPSDADTAVLAAIAAHVDAWPEAHTVPTATDPAAAARIVHSCLAAAPVR
jgi:predicted kinase